MGKTYMRNLAKQYVIGDPLSAIQRAPPTRAEYKEYISTKITVYHERRQREAAETNSKMKYFNIKVKGLNGRPHPAIQGVSKTTDVKKLCAHIKMICCDLYTYKVKATKGGQLTADFVKTTIVTLNVIFG